MHRHRSCLLLGLAITLLPACDVSDLPDTSHTLIIGTPREITTLDFGTTLLGISTSAVNLAYEQLFDFEIADGLPTGALKPELALTLERSADGMSYTVALEPGHHFDDGAEVTAEAIKFSFDRTREMPMGQSDALMWLDEVVVRDRYTVVFRLSQPLPFFPSLLALVQGSIVNPRIMDHEQDGDWGNLWLSEHTAGSGPYRLKHMVRGDRAVFEVNPHGKPPRHFDRIEFKTVLDLVDRKIQLSQGDIDIADGFGVDHVGWFEAQQGLRPLVGRSPEAQYLQMNNEKPPLDDLLVRRAIAMAIDRAAIIKYLYAGLAEPLTGVIPSFVPGFDPELDPIVHDPEQARALLREAGVEPGTRLTFTDWNSGRSSSPTIIMIQQNLREVGFEVAIKKILPIARQEIYQGDFELTLQPIGFDFPDPWIAFNFLFNSEFIGTIGNMARFRNGTVDRLINAANYSIDEHERIGLYQQAQRLIMDAMPLVPLTTYPRPLAIREEIQGLRYNFAQPLLFNAHEMWRAADK